MICYILGFICFLILKDFAIFKDLFIRGFSPCMCSVLSVFFCDFRFIINDVLFIEYYVLLWYILFIVDVINAFITCLLTNMLLKPVGLTFILNLYRKMCT